MAYYSIFPEKDSTIYSHPDRLDLNTGKDEILELVKEKGSNDSNYYTSRILIQFLDSDIKDIFETKILTDKTSSYSSSLELFSAKQENLASDFIIEAYPISESWDEGTGTYSNFPTSSNGCSWLYKDNSTRKDRWITGSFAVNTTGSIDSDIVTKGGGTWYDSSTLKSSQSFSQVKSIDVDLNVTNITNAFSSSIVSEIGLPNGIPNNGFILKYVDIIEEDVSSSKGILSFFSTDTNTIYPPKLTFKWDDSIHTFGAQPTTKTSGELNVSLYRNKKEYNQNDEALIRLHVRDKYPTRQFTSSSNYLEPGYFTTSSYYSIRDAHTEEEIIPFDDNFTKLSADSEGMYFKLYMKGLQPERYYRILFKHKNDDGTEIFDNNYHFKVIR